MKIGNSYKKSIKVIKIGLIWIIMLYASVVGYAGNLDSPGTPSASGATLQDIYNRISSGTVVGSHTLQPSAAPGSTMVTIDEIYNAIPGTASVTAANVQDGVTFIVRENGQMKISTGTLTGGPPKSGQTTSYATGDDGDLEVGATASPRFTDNSNGTVTDNLMGLIWLKNANVAVSGSTWAVALDYVDELNTSGTMNGNSAGDTSNGGSHQTDWRLPNVRELLSLIDFGQYNLALPSGYPFTNVQPSYYWSSTTYASFTSDAWTVTFVTGAQGWGGKSNARFVWAVRGGQ